MLYLGDAMNKIMVIIPDILSNIIEKGEVTDRYYNPGNFFSEVHLVLTNNDNPDISQVQKMVGTAKLHIYNLPDANSIFFFSFGWRPLLLKWWLNRAVKIAKHIQPDIIRCHVPHINALAAAQIKKELNIPYVVSLHINPDEDVRGRASNLIKKLVTFSQKKIERIGLLNANLVMPVYTPIVPYLEKLGVIKFEVCYNTLNPKYLREKDNYSLHKPIQIISVGRQFKEKNPENLIRAVALLNNAELTLVGDGSYHQHLVNVAKECNIENRVKFHKSITNDELCTMLKEFDIFATHTEYWEISKSVLEPLLTGLPVLLNERQGEPVKELNSEICLLVKNTINEYHGALLKLIEDDSFRENLGRRAYSYAQKKWSPEITEQKFVKIYQKIMNEKCQSNND
jgi:glycosyltransferase involved in cell wall biosynthesis